MGAGINSIDDPSSVSRLYGHNTNTILEQIVRMMSLKNPLITRRNSGDQVKAQVHESGYQKPKAEIIFRTIDEKIKSGMYYGKNFFGKSNLQNIFIGVTEVNGHLARADGHQFSFFGIPPATLDEITMTPELEYLFSEERTKLVNPNTLQALLSYNGSEGGMIRHPEKYGLTENELLSLWRMIGAPIIRKKGRGRKAKPFYERGERLGIHGAANHEVLKSEFIKSIGYNFGDISKTIDTEKRTIQYDFKTDDKEKGRLIFEYAENNKLNSFAYSGVHKIARQRGLKKIILSSRKTDKGWRRLDGFSCETPHLGNPRLKRKSADLCPALEHILESMQWGDKDYKKIYLQYNATNKGTDMGKVDIAFAQNAREFFRQFGFQIKTTRGRKKEIGTKNIPDYNEKDHSLLLEKLKNEVDFSFTDIVYSPAGNVVTYKFLNEEEYDNGDPEATLTLVYEKGLLKNAAFLAYTEKGKVFLSIERSETGIYKRLDDKRNTFLGVSPNRKKVTHSRETEATQTVFNSFPSLKNAGISDVYNAYNVTSGGTNFSNLCDDFDTAKQFKGIFRMLGLYVSNKAINAFK